MNPGAEKGQHFVTPARSRRKTAKVITALILLWIILTLTIGCCLLALGVFLYFNHNIAYPYLDLILKIMFDVRLLLVSCGSLVAVSSVVGAVGLGTKKKHLLQVYCYSVTLSLISLCAVVIFLVITKSRIKDVLLYNCLTQLKESPLHFATPFGELESRSGCCGCQDPHDYSKLNLGNSPDSCFTQDRLHDMGCLPLLYQVAWYNRDFLISGLITTALLLLLVVILTSYYIVRLSDMARAWARRVTPTGIMQQNWVTNNNWVSNNNTINENSTGSSTCRSSKSSGFWTMSRTSKASAASKVSAASKTGSMTSSKRSRTNSNGSTGSSRHSSSNRVDMTAVNQIQVKSNNLQRSGYRNNNKSSNQPQSGRREGRVATPYVDF